MKKPYYDANQIWYIRIAREHNMKTLQSDIFELRLSFHKLEKEILKVFKKISIFA